MHDATMTYGGYLLTLCSFVFIIGIVIS